jgi:hypothetical protein
MPTMTLTLEPTSGTESASRKEGPLINLSTFFDDDVAVMYRKIDTTLLSETFRQDYRGRGTSIGLVARLVEIVSESDPGCVVSSIIPSRMTHRPLFAPAGAPSERMNP